MKKTTALGQLEWAAIILAIGITLIPLMPYAHNA